jgi:hypothetical protein
MKDMMYQKKSPPQDVLIRRIMDSAALMRNNRENVQRVTRFVLKRACFCVDNAGNIEEQGA